MTDTEVAIAVAGQGDEVVRRRFGAMMEQFDKGAGDFATTADIEAERAMLAALRRLRPGDIVLGEELGRSESGDSSRVWLIDPLCGTLNYAARMRLVAVNVALMVDGRIVSAAVADPFSGQIFWTDGRAAHVRTEGQDTRLAPTASSRLVDLNLDPPWPNAPSFRTVVLAADPEFNARFKPRVVSSSLALAWVSTGQRAAYITDGQVHDSMHFAAGIAVCVAAGCVVSDLRGGPFDSGSNGLVAAADQETHGTLVRLVGKQRQEQSS